jgi:hypothetical protein
VSSVGAARGGLLLADLARVDAVVVTAEAVSITLAPTAVASTAQVVRGTSAGPVTAEGPEHHIATDKWSDATHSGGPWTPKFQRLFDRAGMSLNDPANRVHVKGHQGPHPQAYHERIYERLEEATQGCLGVEACRNALTAELRRLAKQLSTEGSSLNKST